MRWSVNTPEAFSQSRLISCRMPQGRVLRSQSFCIAQRAKFCRLQRDSGIRAAKRNRADVLESHEVLKVAESEISDYCSHLYGDDEAETSRCWTAYQYYEEQKEAAEKGCDIEIKDGVVYGVNCQRLDSFEDFVRQMLKEGRIKRTVKTLATLAGAEKRKEMRDNAEASTLGGLVQELDDSVPGEAAPATAALRSVLLDVFNEHDYNKDGKMDVAEFRAAMKSLGDELSAKTVSTIYESMGSHGWLSFDEFVSVVEAEEIRAHSRFAKGLRTLTTGQSTWWSQLPDGLHSIDL